MYEEEIILTTNYTNDSELYEEEIYKRSKEEEYEEDLQANNKEEYLKKLSLANSRNIYQSQYKNSQNNSTKNITHNNTTNTNAQHFSSRLLSNPAYHSMTCNISFFLLKLLLNDPNINNSSVRNNKYYTDLYCNIYHLYKSIIDYTDIEKNSLITASILLDRYIKSQSNTKFRIKENNIKILVTTCLIISAKLSQDITFLNLHFSKITHISLKELNIFETNLLNSIAFQLYIEENEFENYALFFNEY